MAATTVLVVAFSLFATPLTASAQQERPFDPSFEVSPANPNADSPVQVQLFFELKEGNSFLKTVAFRIPAGYQLTNSDDMPNGDIIGDGTITLKVGSLGVQNPNLCLSNQAPNTPGSYSTIKVGVQLGSGSSSDCSGLFSLTFTLKKYETGEYGFDVSLPSDLIGQKLDTPVQLIINIYSMSKPNLGAKPPTSGGIPVIKNPKDTGFYDWKVAVDDVAGRHKDLVAKARVDAAKPVKGTSGGTISPPLAIGGAVALLVIIGIVAYLIIRRRRPTAPVAAAAGSQGYGQDYDSEYYSEDAGEHYYDQVPADSQEQQAPEGGWAPPPATDPPSGAPAPEGGYDPSSVDHGSESGTFGTH